MQITEKRAEASSGDRYMTVKEVSEQTGLPYRSLLTATRTGHLRAIRLSATGHGPKHISEKDLNEFLDRASQVAVTSPPDEDIAPSSRAVHSKKRSHSFALTLSTGNCW